MALTPRDILVQNRKDALDLTQKVGSTRTRMMLEKSERELIARISSLRMGANPTFTREMLRTALVQVQEVLKNMRLGMEDTLANGALDAARAATEGTVDYLGRVNASFKGLVAPLNLDVVAMMERAQVGARASVLRRLSSSGEGAPGAPKDAHPAKLGILQRYSMSTIQEFENKFQQGVIQRKSWEEMKTDIVSSSTFLQGKPAFWAERIVRTEMMGAYNRGSWEANREADDQLGDMLKIVSATFDDRTASDSYAVHGQIRRPDEAFESWFGLYQHPPNRPNDREIVVPHRRSWPIPKYLMQRTDAEIAERWAREKRKGAPPPRPMMSTIPMDQIGAVAPPSMKETRARPPRPAIPDGE